MLWGFFCTNLLAATNLRAKKSLQTSAGFGAIINAYFAG